MPRSKLLTYFNGDYRLSVRYPAGWQTDQAQQDGVWYRYFLAPPEGPKRKPPVSVTLLAGPLAGGLEEYAERYLTGQAPTVQRNEERQGAKGRSWRYASADGETRYSLLLLQEGRRIYGLYGQADAAAFERFAPVIDMVEQSLTLERPADYSLYHSARFGFSLRLPPSWRETRDLSSDRSLLLQYVSPPLVADPGPQLVHASLSLSVEPAPNQGDLDALYDATTRKLGDAIKVLSHAHWRDGYADLVRIETPVSVSRAKRYYRVGGGFGYILAIEARDDAFPFVSAWADLIASTLELASGETAPDRKQAQ